MPRKPGIDQLHPNINTINQTNSEMEQEPENENEIHPEIENNKINHFEIDITNIENETIIDHSGYIYNPEKHKKCFLPQTEYAEKLTKITLKVMLAKIKEKTLKDKYEGHDEIYIINKAWYEKWKKFCRYGTLKRIMKAYDTYERKPIKYNPKESESPGIINNKEIMIRFKLNDGRNILVSKYNDALDTKKNKKNDIKLLSKERFKLLNDFFKCDYILKSTKYEDKDNKNYDAFSAHLNIIYLPSILCFNEVNEENYENFKKKNNIIYDIYFRQRANRKEILQELINIYKEKPEILENMGIKLNKENIDIEINNNINSLRYYIPKKDENKKTAQEMLDFILSKETIEKIKKGEKITQNELCITSVLPTYRNLEDLFRLNGLFVKDNMDIVENGFIFVEYIPNEENKKKDSIFDEKIICPRKVHIHNETPIGREHDMDIEPNMHHYSKDYNLDEQPLDEKNNKNGLVGLNNLGNTCYMNTGLQCLSNCELLTKYILGNFYEKFINKENPIGSQGEIIEKYAQLIKHLWYGNRECISPIQFKKTFGKNYQAFNDYRQQDTQEFISYLLDSLHEDLNKVIKKPYIKIKDLSNNLSDEEMFEIKKNLYFCRNQSFICDLIYGFYKSTIYCPNIDCKNISKSFEPFNMITLSLINEIEQRKIEEYIEEKNKQLGFEELYVIFIPFKLNFKPINFKIKIKNDIDIISFKKKVEIITGFCYNTFELYKIKDEEFFGLNKDINKLKDFLEKDKIIYLIQIPPYVFGKENNYFDKIYHKLNNNNDILFLEEEKYEGNDIYNLYNKKSEKKEEKEEKEEKKEEENINKIDTVYQEVINNNKPESEISTKNNEDNDDNDIEMDDKTISNIEIDKTLWIKTLLYNYTYKFEIENEKKIIKEEKIALPRIIYVNKNWNNSEIYECICKILEGVRPDMNEIKEMWFQGLNEITKNLESINKLEENNVYDHFNSLDTQPLMLKYISNTKNQKNQNTVVIYDPNQFLIKKILEEINDNNNINNLEIFFKIIWKQNFANDYKEGIEPIILERSEKLEEIIRNIYEEEYMKKNNIKFEEKNKGKKTQDLNELLNNFNQIEKLSKNNEWYCPKCKIHQLANKKMEIYSISDIVIIHLKRFRNNRKIETLINFPIEGLNLTEFLPNKKNEKYIYDLFAVANHVGGLHGGHYFAYCKNYKNGEWYEFNDSNVDKIDKNKIVTENAYVLFYNRKRENKLNEEELFNKPLINIDHTKYE